MNYDEYNWGFNPALAPTATATTSEDPWLSIGQLGTCIGQACCSDGQVYDSTSNQCVITTTTTNVSTSSTNTESFETINNVLTKQQPGKFKTDYDLKESYSSPLGNSIINKTQINK